MTDLLPRQPWDNSRGWNGSTPAARIDALWSGTDATGPPSPAVGPDSLPRPLRQEIRLYLQVDDLLVQAGDQGVVVPSLLLLAVAQNADDSFGEGFLPCLNLTRLDFITSSQLGHRFLAPLPLPEAPWP